MASRRETRQRSWRARSSYPYAIAGALLRPARASAPSTLPRSRIDRERPPRRCSPTARTPRPRRWPASCALERRRRLPWSRAELQRLRRRLLGPRLSLRRRCRRPSSASPGHGRCRSSSLYLTAEQRRLLTATEPNYELGPTTATAGSDARACRASPTSAATAACSTDGSEVALAAVQLERPHACRAERAGGAREQVRATSARTQPRAFVRANVSDPDPVPPLRQRGSARR